MDRYVLAALCAISASCGVATAADLKVKAPPKATVYEAPYNWTGFYAGGYFGYAAGEFKAEDPRHYETTTAIDDDSWLFGVHGGYRYQFYNNFVLGAELMIPIYMEKGTAQNNVLAFISYEVKPRWGVFANAQAGYAFGRFLPYVLLGGGLGNVKETTFGVSPITGNPTPGASVSTSNTHSFWIAGVGFNYAVWDRVTLGLRYIHTEASKQSYEQAFNAPPPNKFWWTADTIIATVEYKFQN